MSYVIYNKKNKTLREKELVEAYSSNPHGIGIIYTLNGKFSKPIKFFNDWLDIDWFKKTVVPFIHKLNKNKKITNLVVHFRLSTTGKICKENIQPFALNKNMYLMMNGTCNNNIFTSSPSKSDTSLISSWLTLSKPKKLEDISSNYELFTKLKEYLGNSCLFIMTSDDILVIENKKGAIFYNSDKSIIRASSLSSTPKKWSKIY